MGLEVFRVVAEGFGRLVAWGRECVLVLVGRRIRGRTFGPG